MRNVKVCTLETGEVNFPLPDGHGLYLFFNTVRAEGGVRQIAGEPGVDTGVWVPYHAIKMILVETVPNHDAPGAMQ